MRITLDHTALKPGRVALQAENQSKTLVHAVLVVRDDGAKELPFDAAHNRVIVAGGLLGPGRRVFSVIRIGEYS